MKILPLFIPHQGCPFQCIYCNQTTITKSHGARLSEFKELISRFCNKNPEKTKEIAFFGGTFTALDKEIQAEYLNLAKPYQEEIRGIRLSTRPDFITEDILNYLKNNHVATIELGIQSFSDIVLKASARGYSSRIARSACKAITDSGIDLIIQLMPGLPSDTITSFSNTIAETIELQPNGVRLYPTLVLKNTALEMLYHQGKYKPLSLTDTISWLKLAITQLDNNQITITKTGLHSDIDPDEIIAGPFHPAIGELIKIEILLSKLVNNWQQNRTLEISHKDVSLFRGHHQKLIKNLKKELLLDRIPVNINKDLEAGGFFFSNANAEKNW